MDYLLDTNIFIIYSRDNFLSRALENEYKIFSSERELAISAITLGEINSLTKQFRYSKKRQQRIEDLLNTVYTLDIRIEGIIERYGDIDAYSQNKLKENPLGTSSRNMGKNDLWIAATASIFDMTLVTTDKDFSHLHNQYLTLKYINIADFK